MDKTLVIMLGPHAVGKMTVGQELAKMTGLTLFHNHMSIEFVRQLFHVRNSVEGRYLNNLIRCEVFDLILKSDRPGMIFTYMFAFDEPSEYEYIGALIDKYKSCGAKCCVVELCADFNVRLERNKTENRLKNKASKRDVEKSEAEMRATSEKHRLSSYEGEVLPFENYIKIDNTNILPQTVAEMIKERFNL